MTCTPRFADLRAEGVTAAEASDARLELLLAEASRLIDRVTGWFFEPRLLTLRLRGAARRASSFPCRRSASTGSCSAARSCRSTRASCSSSARPSSLASTARASRAATGACSRGPRQRGGRGALGLHRGRRHAHGAHAACDPPRDDAPRPALDGAARRRRLVRGAVAGASSRSGRATRATGSRPGQGFGVGEPHRRPGDRRSLRST